MTAKTAKTANLQIQNKQEYLLDITRRANAARAGDKITTMTLTYNPADPMIGDLTDALCNAAERGVHVLLLIDAHNFLRRTYGNLAGPGRLFWSSDFAKRDHITDPVLLALRRIDKAGGRTVIINKPSRRFSNPFGSRSHIKLTVINDSVYVGGCNLGSNDDIDVMVNWTDPYAAIILRDMCEEIYEAGSTQAVFGGIDSSRLISDATLLLIDAGAPRQSIIFDEAMNLIDEAQEHVFLTCQYFPNHVTAKHLSAARKRGVKVTIVYNNPDKDYAPFNHIHRAVQDLERWRQPADFFERELSKKIPYLHAKVIATETAAIVGSHNYLRAGVTLGTAEIALLRRDADFSRLLVENIESQLQVLH